MTNQPGDADDSEASDDSRWNSIADLDAYDEQWKKIERRGGNPHGEADFVSRFSPASVLDAGCGSGRITIELATRGCDVVGVDLDGPFIESAKQKAPELDFRLADLSTLALDRTFDVIVMAGNVMIFLAPGTEAETIARSAAHLNPGGRLIAGFQLGRVLSVDDYEQAAAAAGLIADEHWSTWELDPASADDNYAVLVHRAPE